MKINKQMLAAVVVTTVAAGGVMGISATSAFGGADNSERAAKLAEKLGVEQSAVESAFSELKDENQAEHEAGRAEQIASLVTDGTLTQAQADALTAKQVEQKAAMETLRDSDATREEMRTQMQESKDAFEAWAEEQGIDLDAIRPEKGEGFGRRGHGPHGPHGPMGGETTDSDSTQ